MKDKIVIAQALNGQVRIHAARTTELVEEARKRHHCMPTSAAALGRTMTVTAIMASDLKNPHEKIQTLINGHGEGGTVLVQADGAGNVRGFIGNPNVYLVRGDGHLAVGQCVGTDGTLTVTRDVGLKEPFTGTSELQSGEIGDDFAYYFAVSEQVPSVVGVGVLVDPDGTIEASGGLIYQLMPFASEEAIAYCEKAAASQRPVSDLYADGNEPEEIIRMYFPDAEILGERDVRFHCGCSKEKFAQSLVTIQTDELKAMIEEDHGAQAVCQYCNSEYNFSEEELREILEKRNRVENRKRLN